MNAHRRTALKPALQLETLDERIAPAHMGIAAVGHVAAAHHDMAVHSRAAAHFNPGAMHASTTRAAALATHHARLISSSSNTVMSSGRVISSTMPASQASNHAATLSPAFTSVIGMHRLRPGTMPTLPIAVATPPPASTTSPVTITASPAPTVTTSSTSPSSTLPASLPAKADGNLNAIYQQYLQFVNSGGTGTFTSPLSTMIEIQGTSVGVQVHGNGTSDFNALVSSLQSMGMQVSATDAVTQTVAGMLPIADLPTATQGLQILSVTAQYRPIMR